MLNVLTRYGIPALLIVGAVAVLVTLFSAASQPGHQNGLKRFANGDLANLEIGLDNTLPTSRFEGPEGVETSLRDIASGPIVLNIWFEACAPCQEEMPSLARLQQEVESDGIKVIAVAVDRAFNREGNRTTLAQLSGDVLDFYFDPSFGVALDAAARGMPTTILYDRNGEEKARLAGGADWSSDEAIALVRAIAAD